MALNNNGMDALLEGKRDTALFLIGQAIACDSSYVAAWHNLFAIQYDLRTYAECITTLRHLKALVPSNQAMFLAQEAQCHFLLEQMEDFTLLREQAISMAEAEAEGSIDVDLNIQVIMIRAMLLGKEDALAHLKALRERGDVPLDFEYYEDFVREMGPVGDSQGAQFSIGPRPPQGVR